MANVERYLQELLPARPKEQWRHGGLFRGVERIVLGLNATHWYGMGMLLHQLWPLEKIALPLAPFLTSDNGATGLLGILEPFWVNAEGFGILVEGDEMEISFNAPRSHDNRWMKPEYKQLPNSDRPPAAYSTETDHALTINGRNLTIRLFEKRDIREAVMAYWDHIPLASPPPKELFQKPMWTTWAQFKNDISQQKILEVAEAAKSFGFTPGVFGIDAKWQAEFGDTSFDPRKFPEPKQMVRTLHELGYEVTLWTVPFIMPASEHFKTAVERGFVFKNENGSPYIGRWWEGESAFVDFTNPAAMQWYGDNLGRLVHEFGINGFKFDAGEGKFYEGRHVRGYRDVSLNSLSKLYLDPLARQYPWSDARAAWRGQDIPMLFRQWDKKTTWGFDNGLASCITGALTLNLLGYRFSFPDMIGGNEWAGDKGDEELIVRWAQAVAAMPVIQFSVPPWREGERCARLCARYAAFHETLAAMHARLAQERLPILRPLWWLAPADEEALRCDDEYLVGDDLLVAPVITAGADKRDIYLPPGVWRDHWEPNRNYKGPAWLRGFPAPLEVLPLFERIEQG